MPRCSPITRSATGVRTSSGTGSVAGPTSRFSGPVRLSMPSPIIRTSAQWTSLSPSRSPSTTARSCLPMSTCRMPSPPSPHIPSDRPETPGPSLAVSPPAKTRWAAISPSASAAISKRRYLFPLCIPLGRSLAAAHFLRRAEAAGHYREPESSRCCSVAYGRAAGAPLGTDGKLRRQQALRLVLGGVGAVDNVADKLRSERQLAIVAIDIACALAVHDKEVVAAGPNRNIGIFAHFDITVGAQHEEAPIAPCAQTIGREPVQPHIAEAPVALQGHVAEILEMRMIGMADIGDLRRHDLGFGRAGIEQELVDLVRADIAKDAAILDIFPEPARARDAAAIVAGALDDLMRRDVDRLDDLADGAGLDQLPGINRGLHFQPLGIHDGVDAAGFRDGSLHQRQIFQCGDSRLV